MSKTNKITYRLSLVDSANRAVQIDVDYTEIAKLKGITEKKILDAYCDLLEEENTAIALSEENDKKVADKLEKTIKQKKKDIKSK